MIKQNETYDDYQKRMERRADILFPTMKRNSGRHSMPGSESQSEHKGKAYVSNRLEREGISREDKDKVKKLKNLPLGKSIYDEDDDDDYLGIKHTHKVKSELDALTDDKYNKSLSSKNDDKQTERKSRKDRTPEEDEKILDLMYPSMRHLGKDKLNQTDDEKSEKNSKNGNFTGGASKIPGSINTGDSEKKESNDIKNTKTDAIQNKNNSSSEKFDNAIFSDNAREKARKFIQKEEGFRDEAYKDIAGIWTIGYGRTENVKPGDKISKEEAEKLFAKDFDKHKNPLNEVKIPLSDNEKIALTSFIYNTGSGAFQKSTLLKKLNKGDKKGVADEFDKWIYSKGKVSEGLKNRRKREKELFLTPDDN